MNRTGCVSFPGSCDASRFVFLAAATAAWCGAVFFTDAGRPLAIPTAYLLPLPLAGLVILAFRLLLSGPERLPRRSTKLGAAFWAGGAWFDMLATFVNTPDLREEANPIARALLDSGHNCLFVLQYAVVCESLLMVAIGLLWAALLSHRSVLIAAASRARTTGQFLTIITGQARLSRRRWLFPFTHRHLPDMYFIAWLLAVALTAGSAYRWCLGVAWILRSRGVYLSEAYEICLTSAAVIFGLTTYCALLRRAADRSAGSRKVTPETNPEVQPPVAARPWVCPVDGGQLIEHAEYTEMVSG